MSTAPVATVAVLSDVHGVAPVLEAVLAEPDVAAADLVVVTGDHVAGPMPAESLDLLLALGDRAVLVRGNADREVADIARGRSAARGWPIDEYAAGRLSPAHLDVLDALPHPVTIEVDGFGPVLFCHGSPRDDDEVVLVDSRLDWWDEVLADVPPEVRTVVGGHTHMPFLRLVDGRLLLNPGSLGMPYGMPGGSWLLLDRGAVTLRRTRVDLAAVAARLRSECGYPDLEAWISEYLLHPSSDRDALIAFGPRDGRDQMNP